MASKVTVIPTVRTQLENLNQAHWEAVPGSIPVIALAFVFHNVVPVVVTSLEGDMRRVRTAIVAGTAIPAGMFLLWDAIILGQIPPGTPPGDPLALLRATDPLAGPWIEVRAGAVWVIRVLS